MVDVIDDFTRVDHDRVDLRRVDADAALAGDQAFSFIGDASFAGQAGQLRYVSETDGIVVEGDTNGDGAADIFIRMNNVADIASADLIL